MAIKSIDYKLQGENLKQAVARVISSPNQTNGRYTKGGFGLDFYSDDYEIENYRWILERAKVADEKIEEARLLGRDIDDPLVLQDIAKEVRKNIESGKKSGSFINYITYLFLPIIIVLAVFFLFLN